VPDEQGALGYQSLGVGVAPIQEQLCSDPGSDELLHDREKYLAEHSKRFNEMFANSAFPLLRLLRSCSLMDRSGTK